MQPRSGERARRRPRRTTLAGLAIAGASAVALALGASAGATTLDSNAVAPVLTAPNQVEPEPEPGTPTTEPRPLARLLVTNRGPGRARAGRVVRYTIRITNAGDATARSLTVLDRLPNEASLVGTPAGVRIEGGNAVWRIAALEQGRSRVLLLRVRFDLDAAGRRTNRVRVQASNASTVRARTSTVVRPLARTVRPAVTG